MKVPSPAQPTERMLIARIALALGLALLLLVGAWSDSHGDGDGSAGLCVAAGVGSSPSAGHDHVVASDALGSDTGAVAACAIVVFLLVVLFLRLGGTPVVATTVRAAEASAPPRAGPIAVPFCLTLTQLSISRT